MIRASLFLATTVTACGMTEPVARAYDAGGQAGRSTDGQPALPRRAALQFRVDAVGRGLQVAEVEAGSPAARSGLRVGDGVVRVNGQTFDRPYVGRDLLRRLDGGRPAQLEVRRSAQTRTLRFTPIPAPLETFPGFSTELGVLATADGARLRTFVSVPEGATGPRPALFFVQWVACRSVEMSPGAPFSDMLATIARTLQLVVLRVERGSNGDSEGPGCHALDFETEVAHYRAAFDALVRHPRVDREQVVVWGSSLGSVTAPFVVAGKRIAALAVGGGGALTYLERMITFDRIRLEREAKDPAQIQPEMIRRIRFHYAYLIDGRDPQAIERDDPDLKGVWRRIFGTGDGVHYGRPFAYHRQAAARNVLGAWRDVKVPVLVMYNEYDQFEAEHGHRLIARTLDRQRAGQATYVRHDQMGHSHRIYPDEYAAHRWDREQRVSGAPVAAATLIRWLRAQVFEGPSLTGLPGRADSAR